jgi:DNA-binding beta-propeller fold protein YncE
MAYEGLTVRERSGERTGEWTCKPLEEEEYHEKGFTLVVGRKPNVKSRGKCQFVKKRLFLVFLCLLALFTAAPAAFGSMVLVTGHDSDNVVQFDLTTGKWSEIARLPKNAHPRGITVSDKGEIFLGLQGAGKNIIELVSSKGSVLTKDVTRSIGRFGPGLIAYGHGEIWAAGDTERTIYSINPQTGAVFKPSQYKNRFNLVGLAGDGETLYAAEYFQRSILRYDLKAGGTNAIPFISASSHLNRPVGMTIGHNGNLYVANALKPTVAEFDIKTGDYVRTLVNLGAAGRDGINGIVYAPDAQRYYLASGSDVYELDSDGKIMASYNSPALRKAYGIALLPEQFRSTVANNTDNSQKPGPSFAAISTLKMTTPGHLHISGKAGEHYQIMATTDFRTWQPIATLENSTGMVEFVDPDAGNFDKRFYRIEMLPEK